MPITRATVKMLYRDCKVSRSTTLALSVSVFNSKGGAVNDAKIKTVKLVETFQVFAVVRSASASFMNSTIGRVTNFPFMSIG